VDALRVEKRLLLDLLHLPSEQARREMIDTYLRERAHADAFAELSAEVRRQFDTEMKASRWACGKLLRYPRRGGNLGLKESVRYVLSFYYRFFEDFDQVSFPVFYSTDVGEETDPIEVFRVSPEDASLLVDEKEVNAGRGEGEGRIDKLAGTTVGHFGAFFDERYRVNDILWGRLDGAERIVSALLPGESDVERERRKRLVREAHGEIIRETWGKELSRLDEEDPALAAEVRGARQVSPGDARLRDIEGRLKARNVGALWRRFFLVGAGKRDADVVEDFKRAFLESYTDEREFSLSRKVKLAAGGGVVLFKILHANLRENRRKRGPVWGVVAGLLLTIGGFGALLLGLLRTVGGMLRFVTDPLRRAIDRVNAGGRG
jgi:hypothetical protein